MKKEIKVFTPDNIEDVLKFEMDRLAVTEPDEMQRNFHSWSARWRKESLEHYANTGWSFVVTDQDSNKIRGYLLGQAFVFFRGQTQTLWIEHLSADSQEIKDELVEIAYRWSRDKHLQKVVFSDASQVKEAIMSFKGYACENNEWEIKTTKSQD